MRLPARPLALALALAATGVGVAAARTPLGGAAAVLGGDPLDMSAEHLDLDVASKTAVLTGAVQVKKGAVTVTCPRVDVRYDEVPHVTWIKGSGGVVAAVEGVRAEAPEVELDVARQVLELRGGVKLTRGSGWLTAERASIQVATGKVSMSDVRGSIPAGRASSSAVAPPSAPAASAAPNAAP